MRNTTRIGAALLAAVLATPLAACGGDGGDGDVTIEYWLWDDNQLPSYQQCADAFAAANPGVKVNVTQTGWAQYWPNLTTQLAAADAPDVWTNHISYHPQWVENNQILDITPFVGDVDLSIYQPGLADLWTKDGKRYGLPKDWDTLAVAYNKKYLDEAGVDPSELDNLTWNPTDGGTFEETIAKATLDENGRDGLDPDFDKTKVKQYGFLPEWDLGQSGQSGWGNFAASNGFTWLDQNPWGTKYTFNDPALVATIDWYKKLLDKGYVPPVEQALSVEDQSEIMHAGGGAMSIAGSWLINTYLGEGGEHDFGFAMLPEGPQGRKSFINGLSDAIYAGTEHPEESAKWVTFLASSECQDIVASNAVVFPAITTASEKASAAHEAAGRDVHAFTDMAAVPNGTLLLPVAAHGNEISEIVEDAIISTALGDKPTADALAEADQQVNELLAG